MRLIASVAAVFVFTLGACADGAEQEGAEPAQAGTRVAAAFPNRDDGRPITLLGLNWLTWWGYEDPFLDLAKQNRPRWTAISADGKNKMEYEDLLAAGHIDPVTLLPVSLPKGFDRYDAEIYFRRNAEHDPESHGGVYVIDWEGEAEIGMRHGLSWDEKGRNRIEIFFAKANRRFATFWVRPFGDGLTRLRVYRKDNEARLNAGQLYDPRFLDHVARYKIVRPMDWQGPNGALTRSIDQVRTVQATTWGGGSVGPPPHGVPLGPLFRLAREADVALWLTAPGMLGAPASVDAARKLFETEPERLRAVSRQAARSIVDSTEWDRYADAIVTALIDEAYPEDRMLYVELSNEVWNFGPGFSGQGNWFYGLGEGLKDGAGYRYGYGYASARLAVAVDDALKRRGRAQAITTVIGSQMNWVDMTTQALDGYRAFFAERDIDPALWLARAGVSTASYYSGIYRPGAVVAAPAQDGVAAAFLAAIERDPETLARRARELIVTRAIPEMIRFRKEHQAAAERAGAFFLGDYEGGDHDLPPEALATDPASVNWIERWRYGSDGEAMTRAWADALIAQNPDAVIANYMSVGPSDPEGDSDEDRSLAAPWIDGWYGEENGRTRALDGYLRAPR